MIGELGYFALVWVVVSSSISSCYYGWSTYKNKAFSLSSISKLNGTMATFSLIILAVLFAQDQFQYHYVASHSNVALPIYFKVAAVWGGHQGSMLFWLFTLAVWSALISFLHQPLPKLKQDVLWVMTIFIAVFGWFTLLASNPYEFSEQMVEQGRDLNPMLQDIGLILHPPLLYLGYIGYSTVFAFALAVLLNPQYKDQWVSLCLPWAISSWLFLSLGILLGSWWAYNELGWGGWWFWDPVENASLLPWITGTALLHAMIAVKRNKQMQLWTLTLALITFCLSILGTFIVRSGVFTSVHAFAVSPSKGIALLLILSLSLFVGLILLLTRSEYFKSATIKSILGRNYLILISLGLLSVACFTVLLGTFYPMIYQLAGFGRISVGAPYFNILFLPLTILALVTIGLVPFFRWNEGVAKSWQLIVFIFILSLALGAGLYSLQVTQISLKVALVWGLACWVIVGHLILALELSTVNFMFFAHIGLAIAALGAVMNAEHSFEINQKMTVGTVLKIADWRVEYLDTKWYIGTNFTAQQAVLKFNKSGKQVILQPERRHYPVRVMNMTEPAIHSVWNGDYYVTLGSKISSKTYAVKIQFRAYVNWIWTGALLAIFGACIKLGKKTKLRARLDVAQQV